MAKQDSWPQVPISHIATAIKDGSHGTHLRSDGGVPLLSAKNVSEGGLLEWGREDSHVSEAEFALITAGFAPQAGDLLLTVVGSLGRRAIFDGSRVAFQRSVAFVRPDKTKASSDYLFQATGTEEFFRQLVRRSNATAQAGLYLGELAKVTIPLPPKEQQRAICSILGTIDYAIERREALIGKFRQIKAGLMHDLFTRGLDADGRLRPVREEAPEKYKQSSLGWIPREWSVSTLLGFAQSGSTGFVNGPFGSDLLTAELTDSGVPVIYVRDIRNGSYTRVSKVCVSSQKADVLTFCNVRKNDVLVAKVGDPPCDAAAYLENQRSIITQDVIRIRPNSETSSSFLVGLINSPIGKRAISRFIIEGTRARVSLTEFKQIRMPRPPYPEQVQMGAALDSFENKIKNEEQGLLKAILEKQGLANDLLKGSVRVKADEPTHV